MSLHGEKLGVELSDLYGAGRQALPDLAYTYAMLNRDVDDTSDGDTKAFSEYESIGSMTGESGALYSAWSELRDRLWDALGRSANHLEATGHALVAIANNYAQIDAEAARKLHNTWYTKDEHGHEHLSLPPGYQDMPGDTLAPGSIPSVRIDN